MPYNFSTLNQNIKETENWLEKEFSAIRTGRATPTLLDTIQVESYGSMVAINNVASVTTEDARTLRISPWDSSQIQAIEKAIQISNLGISPVVDDKGLRVVFPELTGERRQQLMKVVKQKLEEGRVRLRQEREKVWKDIQTKEKNGEMGEDERNRLKTEMEKIVTDANKRFDEIFARKEKEIEN